MRVHFMHIRTLLASSALALLAACGGGGGDSGTDATYTVSGQLSGLLAGQSVSLQNNGADSLNLRANGSFTFDVEVPENGAYAVTVITQPAGQRCTVANGSGRATANVSNVAVTCQALASNTYTVGGAASGLGAGKTVVLQNNGRDDLTVSANGGFTFATAMASGAAYAVTIRTQPAGQTCSLSAASGTVNANVSNIGLSCQDSASAALKPVYLADTYRADRTGLLAQANGRGGSGYAFVTGLAFTSSAYVNLYVKDAASTYTWEAMDLPTTASALQTQLNTQGARGYAHHGFLVDGGVYSVYYVRDAQGLGPYTYELLPSQTTSSAFLTQANAQGARGFFFQGDFAIGGATVAIYGKDSSNARYSYAVQAPTGEAAPDVFVAQANTQGQQGYRFIGEYVFSGNPSNEAFKNVYARDTAQAATFEYKVLAASDSGAALVTQANTEGQSGYFFGGEMAFFPSGYGQPGVTRNVYGKPVNCTGVTMCRGSSPF